MKQFLTVKSFVQKHPGFLSDGGIRHIIFNSDLNGFHVCIRRVGRRILLDEAAVFAWVDSQSSSFKPKQ